MTGWRCPSCGVNYAPQIAECRCSAHTALQWIPSCWTPIGGSDSGDGQWTITYGHAAGLTTVATTTASSTNSALDAEDPD